MDEPFLGELLLVAFDFAPRNWALCDGSLLPIRTNQALFSLLGTAYGGDGTTTFGLPDLRGRAPMSFASELPLGAKGGQESVALTSKQLPAHSHTVACSIRPPDATQPANNFFGGGDAGHSAPAANRSMNPGVVAQVGENLPHENRMPSLAMNWIISLTGAIPRRGQDSRSHAG